MHEPAPSLQPISLALQPMSLALQPMSVFALSLAALLFSGPALAQESPAFAQQNATNAQQKPDLDNGWDKKMGMLVSLNNPFQSNDILTPYQGYGVAGLVTLSPTSGLRLGLDIGHFSDPYYEIESETTFDGDTTSSSILSNRYGGPTSAFSLGIGAEFLQRGSKAALAPYFGGGMGVGLGSEATVYLDEVSDDDISTSVDSKTKSFQFGLRGVLGADWRVHRHFSFFAEYGLSLSLVDTMRSTSVSTVVNSAGETSTTTTVSTTGRQSPGPAMGTDLTQGAALGLITFF
jgi:opacity protein-like surface antigen